MVRWFGGSVRCGAYDTSPSCSFSWFSWICGVSCGNRIGTRVSTLHVVEGGGGAEWKMSKVGAHRRDERVVGRDEAEAAGRDLVDALLSQIFSSVC